MKTRTALIVGTLLAAASGSALAHGNVSFGISFGVPGPVYAPAPVYVAPAPVYAPPAVVYPPAPAYYYPPAAVYVPPQVVYPAPPYYGGRRLHWRGYAYGWGY